MPKRYIQTIISFLVIFLLSLGNSLAGGLTCLPDCPDCAVVYDCCGGKAHSSGPDAGGTTGHLPVPKNCSDGDICHSADPPIDLAPANGGSDDTSLCITPQYAAQIQPSPISRGYLPVALRSPLKRFPQLFLQNCSFLI